MISLSVFSQREVWYEPAPKGMEFVPQGSFNMKVDTSTKPFSLPAFWMSNEITNKEYREFTDFAKANPAEIIKWHEHKQSGKDKKEIIEHKFTYKEIMSEICVDSLAVSKEFEPGSEMYKKYENYFTGKDFDEFPVVGVTYNGAKIYCIWKTTQENKLNKEKGDSLFADYRLPVYEEMLYVASFCTPERKNQLNQIMKVNQYKENKTGYYNVIGNVCEWVSVFGKTEIDYKNIFGGSWKSNDPKYKRGIINSEFRSGTVGFRIVKSYLGNLKKEENK